MCTYLTNLIGVNTLDKNAVKGYIDSIRQSDKNVLSRFEETINKSGQSL